MKMHCNSCHQSGSWIVIAFAYLFFISCSPEIESPPDPFIPKDQMAKILVEIHVAEASIQNNFYISKNKTSAQMMSDFENYILKKNEIDKETYKANMTYYTRNIELLDEVYGIVMDSLTRLEETIPK